MCDCSFVVMIIVNVHVHRTVFFSDFCLFVCFTYKWDDL